MIILDRMAMAGMAVGVCIIIQPWWEEGLRAGFFTTLFFTALHIYTSHRVGAGEDG